MFTDRSIRDHLANKRVPRCIPGVMHFTLLTIGAAVGAFFLASPALSGELNLPREHVALVPPPFVHPHEQATNQGPKIVEFTLTVEEKRMDIATAGPR